MDKSTLFMKDHLVQLIEDKLGWGKGSTWGNKDFEELGERIFQDTRKRLSVTTLKRIWGRTEWVANPSMATLDILSDFVGYENWREFVRLNKEAPTKHKISRKSKPSKIWVLVLILVLIGSFLGFLWNGNSIDDKAKTIYNAEDFLFKSRTIGEGIPNSVVFEYQASAAKNGAKIEIQQDWDRNKRTQINRNDSIATSIYYHPGFFKSKLVVDDTILKENDVFITTDDWLGIIERDSVPIYLHQEEIYTDSLLSINRETVTSYILYDGGAIGIPLSKKGCVSGLNLMTFEDFIDGKKNDLSGFGVDFKDYINLKCVSENQQLEILVNNMSTYKMNVPNPALKIKGITIHFEGAGSVKNVEFRKDAEIVYQSDFSKL